MSLHIREQHCVPCKICFTFKCSMQRGKSVNIREPFHETVLGFRRAVCPISHAFGASVHHILRHAKNMAVINAENYKSQSHTCLTCTRSPLRFDLSMASIAAWAIRALLPAAMGTPPLRTDAAKSSMMVWCQS